MTDKTEKAAIENAAPTRAVEQADAELKAAGDKIAQLELDAEAAKTAHEAEVADLKAKLAAAEESNAKLQAAFASGVKPKDADADGNYEVRVKTPMLVNPPADLDMDPAPEPYRLVGGGALNMAPAWVADHPFVKANLVEE